VAAARLAELPLAHRRLLIHAELVGAARDLHGLGFHSVKALTVQPTTNGMSAMTIAHPFRFSGHLDLHGTAEALPFVRCHDRLLTLF